MSLIQRKQRYHIAVSLQELFLPTERRAPQAAGAHVDHGVKVLVTKSHLNETAGSGCHVTSCSLSSLEV